MRWLAHILLLVASAVPVGAAERPADFVLHPGARPVPEVHFTDGEGRPRSLADFRGKVILLNLWATWCPPCRHEMPSLDRLQAMLGGADFEVAALSVDRAGIEPVRRFYDEIGVRDLVTYIDPSGRAVRTLGAVGLPTTLLLDEEGREVGRVARPAVWDSPAMVAFLRERVGQAVDGRTPGNDNGVTKIFWPSRARDRVTEAPRPPNEKTGTPW